VAANTWLLQRGTPPPRSTPRRCCAWRTGHALSRAPTRLASLSRPSQPGDTCEKRLTPSGSYANYDPRPGAAAAPGQTQMSGYLMVRCCCVCWCVCSVCLGVCVYECVCAWACARTHTRTHSYIYTHPYIVAWVFVCLCARWADAEIGALQYMSSGKGQPLCVRGREQGRRSQGVPEV
jgi:hypothetical protein